MTAAEIRQIFLDYFSKKHDHRIVPSAPVFPQDDPTLLFTNAGMNQFKDVFLGKGERAYTRAVDSQKCIRVSGKHNDLEEVGPSPIHHTFFEMLGNWSFGDYYKAEAIRWAWELMTEVYKLDKSKLYATVYREDDEAHKLWETETDMAPSHISRHGDKDNFWEMGEVGPCGPCSELHYDLGEPLPGKVSGPDDGPNTDTGRFIELWNLVFIQHHRDADGTLHDLPATHVDTGAGLERIARVTQGVNSNYETDLFLPLIKMVEEMTAIPYDIKGIHIPHRVISDHIRSLSFAIADGALPSNEGRGYVLRRILRRAARFGRELNIDGPFLVDMVPVLVDLMGNAYPELKQREKHIRHVIQAEEESFGRTLSTGLVKFNEYYSNAIEHLEEMDAYRKWAQSVKAEITDEMLDSRTIETLNDALTEIIRPPQDRRQEFYSPYVLDSLLEGSFDVLKSYVGEEKTEALVDSYAQIKQQITLGGTAVFDLYQTYGFPLDLTQQMARERGVPVDEEGFRKALEAQRAQSRDAHHFVLGEGKFITVTEGRHSEYVGYDRLTNRTSIRVFRFTEGEWNDAKNPDKPAPTVEIILERTPFYAESGGQVADFGTICGDELELEVTNVYQDGDMRVHVCKAHKLPEEEFDWPGHVVAAVDVNRRGRIIPHHTTTHLVQAALQKYLGKHISQAGSWVGPDYMTFDFTHFEKVPADIIRKAEDQVNEWIRADLPVSSMHTTVDEAKEMGAMALFGEKYGDVVRMISIGEEDGYVSRELCGGTHVQRTGEVSLFRIESESAVSAGVRRIECTAGEAAYVKTMQERDTLNRMIDMVGSRGSDPAEKLQKLMDQKKDMEKEIDRLKKAALQGAVNFINDWGGEINLPSGPVTLISGVYDAATDRDALQAAGDKILEDLKKAKVEGIGIVGAPLEKTFMFVTVVTPELVKSKLANAGKIVGAIAKKAGGGGGGKPNFATAGSKNLDNANSLLRNRKEIESIVSDCLSSQ